jgi:hypothetical protein
MFAIAAKDDPTAPPIATPAMAAAANEQLARWSQFQAVENKIFDTEQTVTQAKGTQAADAFKRWQEFVTVDNSAANAQNLGAADGALAGDFVGQSAGPEADAAGAATSTTGPPAALVLASIYATHPTGADISAFRQALALATSSTYTPARAVARITLVAAVLLGERAIGHDLGFKTFRQLRRAPAITLASIHTSVPKGHSAKRVLKASALGGRILRLLSIVGLTHKISIALTVSERTSGKSGTHTVTRSLRVR